ncbi:hypothetical protein HJG60_010310 [Phyllostomus discolor]|uniref:Uncharacterized protein n=1 Tax=Phyllostomus discolor TaxID=89673 RepID=A0A834ASV7_9CHIR|nr:hypothetical protein HJG60_010310 [Phyllostomus discolor]
METNMLSCISSLALLFSQSLYSTLPQIISLMTSILLSKYEVVKSDLLLGVKSNIQCKYMVRIIYLHSSFYPICLESQLDPSGIIIIFKSALLPGIDGEALHFQKLDSMKYPFQFLLSHPILLYLI